MTLANLIPAAFPLAVITTILAITADACRKPANPRTEPHVPADVDLTQMVATVRAIDERGRE